MDHGKVNSRTFARIDYYCVMPKGIINILSIADLIMADN